MIPACDRRSDGRTESIIAKTALCIASYADALSTTDTYSNIHNIVIFTLCMELWKTYALFVIGWHCSEC